MSQLKKDSNQPFLRSSGLPFLTVAKTISPLAAAGSRFNRPRIPPTAMIYKFFAPAIINDKFKIHGSLSYIEIIFE